MKYKGCFARRDPVLRDPVLRGSFGGDIAREPAADGVNQYAVNVTEFQNLPGVFQRASIYLVGGESRNRVVIVAFQQKITIGRDGTD